MGISFIRVIQGGENLNDLITSSILNFLVFLVVVLIIYVSQLLRMETENMYSENWNTHIYL